MKRSWILEDSDTSLTDKIGKIRTAVHDKFDDDAPGSEPVWAEAIFDDYVVLSKGGKLWRVDFTMTDDGDVTFTAEPVEVAVRYVPVTEGSIFAQVPEFETRVVTPATEKVENGTTLSVSAVTESVAKMTGKKWSVLIIQEGLSKNRNRYTRKVLQEAAPLYEGKRIFIDHQEEQRRFGRSVNDQAGFIKDINPVLLAHEAEGPTTFALAATAVITKKDIRDQMREAYDEGNPNLFGLSHDAMCRSTTCMDDQQVPFYDVTKIESVQSVDLVTNPAAGGRVLRLVASDTVPHTLSEDGTMLQKMIEAITASKRKDLIEKLEALGKEPNEDQVLAIYTGLMEAEPKAEPKPEAEPGKAAKPKAEPETDPKAAEPVKEGEPKTTPKDGEKVVTESEFKAVLRDSRESFIDATLAGTSLPEEAKDRLQARFRQTMDDGHIPTKEAVTAAVQEEVGFFAKLAEKGMVMPATGTTRAQVTKETRDQIAERMDEFFGVVPDDKVKGGYRVAEASEERLVSFRQLYADVTGDRDITGLKKEATRLTEALDTSSWDQILGDSITRRMVAEYVMGAQAQWRNTIANVVPVSDFRTQRRMRFGGYGNLSTVGQGAAYPALTSPTDEEATYSPAKRGGTEQVTIEMIANDDVGSIRRIPTKLARAAGQTLYEFVLDFMATNPLIYDGVALSAAGHNNDSTTALSATQMGVLRLQLKNQTDMSSGKRLGLPARYLWVPSDLEELAFWLTSADRALPDATIPGTAASGAPNFIRKQGIIPVTVDYWTDVNNWWLTSSIQETPMIEIGFLGGREEPELFVQDVPNVGSMFSNDQITYKIRHIYGGAVLDYRGFAGAIVA